MQLARVEEVSDDGIIVVFCQELVFDEINQYLATGEFSGMMLADIEDGRFGGGDVLVGNFNHPEIVIASLTLFLPAITNVDDLYQVGVLVSPALKPLSQLGVSVIAAVVWGGLNSSCLDYEGYYCEERGE